MADSCHLGFCKFIPMFTTSLIFLALHLFHLFLEVCMRWFYAWKRMKVYMINFYHHYSLSGFALAAGRILFRHQVLMQMSLFSYAFWRPAVFGFNTILNVEDFCSTYSNYKLTTELFKYHLFQKLSKDFGFHSNQCKMQIMYGNAHDSWCIIFKPDFISSSCMLPSFILRRVCLPKITFFAVQITKDKLKFRKIENMQLWHFVTNKRNPLNLNNFRCI